MPNSFWIMPNQVFPMPKNNLYF